MNSVHNPDKKIFLISGASSGIGNEIAKYLATQGNIIFAGARKESDIQELNQYENITGIQLDVTIPEQINSTINLIRNTYGYLDVLINNAGIPGWGAIMDLKPDYFKEVIEVNLIGYIRLSQAGYPLLRNSAKFPIIFNISSQGAKYAFPFWAPYHITKFGVRAFSDALRRELIPFNIRVCELQLGPFKSKAFEKQKQLLEDYKMKQIKSEFTPRLLKMFEMIVLNPKRKEKSPIKVAKLIEKLSSQLKYKVRYEPGRKRLASTVLTKFPPKWVDKMLLKKF
ncbi:MAG: SDR family NAD(P)-dependent oxidoreductase [Candidatus Lokiarchaeota archaeon]|nr:SDR family NAD(P)-dependent oxidoreductase [Candidatus Lokiarchaeota archaeon]